MTAPPELSVARTSPNAFLGRDSCSVYSSRPRLSFVPNSLPYPNVDESKSGFNRRMTKSKKNHRHRMRRCNPEELEEYNECLPDPEEISICIGVRYPARDKPED